MEWRLTGLSKAYGDVKALDSLSFELGSGHSLALLGPNGSGKTTAIKILTSLIRPDQGRLACEGQDLFGNTQQLREMIGYVSQELALDKTLTGQEFMAFQAGIQHVAWRECRQYALELLDRLGLSDASSRQIGTYSGGMKRRLDLAAALLNHPKLLIIDEPTTGLDIQAREYIWELITTYVSDGGALLLASHDFQEVDRLAEEILILNQGQTQTQGTSAGLKRQLGSHVLRLKTREYMQEEDFARIHDVMGHWGQAYRWMVDHGWGLIAVDVDADFEHLHHEIGVLFQEHDLSLSALNVQTPTLEDVYRFAVGGAD